MSECVDEWVSRVGEWWWEGEGEGVFKSTHSKMAPFFNYCQHCFFLLSSTEVKKELRVGLSGGGEVKERNDEEGKKRK